MQSTLYRLESVAEEALYKLDAVVGRKCMDWLEKFEMFPSDYVSMFVHEIALRYATETKPGKNRFRQLPAYLDMIDAMSPEYRDYEESMNRKSRDHKFGLDEAQGQIEFKW